MQKLTIEINSQTGNFGYSLDEIKKQVENGFFEGLDKNEEEDYNFKIIKK